MGGKGTGSRHVAWALALLLGLSGCGFEGDLPAVPPPPPPPVPPSQAALLLSLSSSPIDAAASADGSAPWSADWTLTVKETAGIGGTIERVTATLVDDGGASLAETQLDADQIRDQLGGSNRIAGGSSQAIAMSLTFDFPADAPSGDLTVTVELSDDRGNAVSTTVADVVRVCIPAQVSPADAAVMDNGCSNGQNGVAWDFDWDDCPNAEMYSIHIDHPTLEAPIDRDLTVSAFSTLTDSVVPEESRIGWTWKVRAMVNGVWGNYSPDRKFDVERVNTDCVNP